MTKIKICGIRTIQDALAAVDAGADLIGFNFYSKSQRYIEVGMCRNIMSVMRRYGHITYIGVFVNAPVEDIRAIMQTCGLSLAQLHGDETPENVSAFNGKAFKAIRLSTSEAVETSVYPFISVDSSVHPFLSVDPSVQSFAKQFAETSVPESVHPFLSVDLSVHPFAKQSVDNPVLLVDASAKGLYGGSGVTADWNGAAELAKKFPLLLAGGLTPENVADAIRQVRPWGVDVASGVESAPGEKDAEKMLAFVKAVRAAESQ